MENPKFAILQWQAWDKFLIQYLLPEAQIIDVILLEDCKYILDQLDKDITHCVLHVDLSNCEKVISNIELLIKTLRSRNILVLNFDYLDLSKKKLQATLKSIGLPTVGSLSYIKEDDLVIVKSNANYGEEREKLLSDSERKCLGVTLSSAYEFSSRNYLVYPYKEIGQDILNDPAIAVERYIHSEDDTFFRVYIAGNSMIIVKAYCEGKIKKLSGDERDINCFALKNDLASIANVDGYSKVLASTLETFIRNVNIDFGSLDIVHRDNEYFIVDVNTTPWGGEHEIEEMIVNFLRSGLQLVT